MRQASPARPILPVLLVLLAGLLAGLLAACGRQEATFTRVCEARDHGADACQCTYDVMARELAPDRARLLWRAAVRLEGRLESLPARRYAARHGDVPGSALEAALADLRDQERMILGNCNTRLFQPWTRPARHGFEQSCIGARDGAASVEMCRCLGDRLAADLGAEAEGVFRLAAFNFAHLHAMPEDLEGFSEARLEALAGRLAPDYERLGRELQMPRARLDALAIRLSRLGPGAERSCRDRLGSD